MSRGLTIICLVILALVAFAANSVLGRVALLQDGVEVEIGPWSYTLIRIVSGAAALMIIMSLRPGPITIDQAKTNSVKTKPIKAGSQSGTWRGAVSLVVYGVFFSFAYLLLPAGTGALILFAAVQLTMLGYGFYLGERLSLIRWLGLLMAVFGLFYLLAPGLAAPSLGGSVLMILAGLGWGAYSILGKASGDPIRQTAGNFTRAGLILMVLSLPLFVFLPEAWPTPKGWILALSSGVITSALGYVVWYHALKDVSVTQAGLSQLCVPALAALGGVVFIGEPLTLRFVIASLIILCGVALSTLYRAQSP